MVMGETSRTTSPYSMVSEFEGTLLKSDDPFSYFMLLAFDASGVIRFAVLLFLWPVTTILTVFSYKDAALKIMIFIAMAGLRESDIELVARDVLPKFYMDDLSMDTWNVFSSCKKRIVVTRMPRVMVERFAKQHLRAEEEQIQPVQWNQQVEGEPPNPVIFHVGALVKRPTPSTAFIILLCWFPFGIILALIRMLGVFIFPMWLIHYVTTISGCRVTVKGKPPPKAGNAGGLLFVCNHRTTIDPVVISYALGRSIPAVILSTHSRVYDILSPVPIVRFTRNRDVDAVKMKQELSKGDLVVCPEGYVGHQPFVIRLN